MQVGEMQSLLEMEKEMYEAEQMEEKNRIEMWKTELE